MLYFWEFEWDPAKADSNLAKHGIDFVDAIKIFDDPALYVIVDARVYGERRYKALGLLDGKVLLIVYTMRGDNICRLISARRANRRERTAYSLSDR